MVQPKEKARELDELTLARARRGDRQAQGAFVEQYQGRVHGCVARMLVRQPQLVEDTAQEVFLKALRALPRFEPSGSARLSTWLLTIATRTCLDLLRRPERAVELVREVPAPEAGPEQLAAGQQLGDRVAAVMATMPDHQRAVLVLRGCYDLDYDEIAEALGSEKGTIKSRLNRARQALRRALEGDRDV